MIGKTTEFRGRLLKWYALHRRDLPWRPSPDAPRDVRVDAYHVLVSELMLQQTQVATVIPYYRRFLERFPTAQSLAAAEEQEVLRFWQGLGYYSRARNLHRAAKMVASELKDNFPNTAQLLRDLPGVGRYTAGAVASIAFDEPAPIVDGNVARVLARVDRIEKTLDAPDVRAHLWERAAELVVGERPGDFNSAMMELGATVCVPRGPKCLVCPVAKHCEARAAGVQGKLPLPKKRAATPLLRRDVICVIHKGKWLIEQRPAKGRWASMWQFVTVEANGKKPRAGDVIGGEVKGLKRLGLVTHGLTHRRYEFEVYGCERSGRGAKVKGERVWVGLDELAKYPLPGPHLKVAEMLRKNLTKRI